MTTQEGPTTLYLKPITRILSDTPTVVDCFDELPIKFAIDKDSSICQTESHSVQRDLAVPRLYQCSMGILCGNLRDLSVPHQVHDLPQEEEEVHILLPDMQPIYRPRPSTKPSLIEQAGQKYRMKTIEEQITLQGNQAKLYDANIKVALSRVGILEKENGILTSEPSYVRAHHLGRGCHFWNSYLPVTNPMK